MNVCKSAACLWWDVLQSKQKQSEKPSLDSVGVPCFSMLCSQRCVQSSSWMLPLENSNEKVKTQCCSRQLLLSQLFPAFDLRKLPWVLVCFLAIVIVVHVRSSFTLSLQGVGYASGIISATHMVCVVQPLERILILSCGAPHFSTSVKICK